MSNNIDKSQGKMVAMRQNAWYGDDLVELDFPASWQVDLISGDDLPPLSPAQYQKALQTPVFSLPLPELARKSRKPVILVDDLTRPTPVDAILLLTLDDLHYAGIPDSDITILIACGTHKGITTDEISRKLGFKIPGDIRVLVHNCHDYVQIGYTSTNTPIQVNRIIMECDLKIGIGGIFPHPVAGFSGGGKLLALGAGGFDTIRILHDQKEGAQFRDGNIDHAFRREINEITKKVGYDFSINLVLNANREVAGVFCGDPEKAFLTGVDFYRQHFSVNVHDKADIVISDMYPFDNDFQYAFDRGLWPFRNVGKHTLKIILAASPQGISDHTLFPVKNPFFTRILRRMKYFRLRDIIQLKQQISSLLNVYKRRKMVIFVVSPVIKRQDLLSVLPNGILVESWNEMERVISQRFARNSNKNVAIYKTAPLLMARRGNNS